MSGWKLAMRVLAERGPMTLDEVESATGGMFPAKQSLWRASRHGLVVSSGHHGQIKSVWSLSDIGRDFIAGRLEMVAKGRGGKHQLVAVAA